MDELELRRGGNKQCLRPAAHVESRLGKMCSDNAESHERMGVSGRADQLLGEQDIERRGQ